MSARHQDRIAVILVNWNNFGDTAECLDSLAKLEYPDYRVIVVDNGSTDSSAKRIREDFPDVELIEAGANIGLAAGNNAGIRRAAEVGAEFVLLLNNDTIVDWELLSEFAAAAADIPSAAFFGAKIYHHGDPDRIWWAMPRWDPHAAAFFNEGTDEIDDDLAFGERCGISYANGCALFFRMAALPAVGLMDERFFVYFEDVDWCFRGRAEGYGSLFVPAAKVWHKVARTNLGRHSPMVAYFETRNQLLWSEKHLTGPARETYRRRVIHPVTGPLLGGIPGNGEPRPLDPRGEAALLGLTDYLMRRFGDCPDSVRRLAAPTGEVAR